MRFQRLEFAHVDLHGDVMLSELTVRMTRTGLC